MASIERRAGGWRVRWRDPIDGGNRSRQCPDQATAKALARDIEREHALGRSWQPAGPGPVATPLLEVAAAYLREEAQRLAPRTLERYGEALDLWLRWVELAGIAPTVGALTRPHLSDWRTWLVTAPGRHGRLRTAHTAGKLVQVVELMWAWAEESERWPDVPTARRLRHPSAPRPLVRAPGWEQVDSMLDELHAAAETFGHRAPEGAAPDWCVRLVVLARHLGGRREELLLARWDRLGRDELVLPSSDTKGGYGGRVVPVSSALATWLSRWREADVEDRRRLDRIVASPVAELDGRGHSDRLIRRAWARAGIEAELWHGRPLHALRRTLRTHLVALGTQADVVDAILGHAGTGTGSRHYTDRSALLPLAAKALATVPAWEPRCPR